jgi:hypothetical protein
LFPFDYITEVARILAFRGGTALYKLHVRPPAPGAPVRAAVPRGHPAVHGEGAERTGQGLCTPGAEGLREGCVPAVRSPAGLVFGHVEIAGPRLVEFFVKGVMVGAITRLGQGCRFKEAKSLYGIWNNGQGAAEGFMDKYI